MDSQNKNSEPRLSKYFINDSPTLFDDLVNKTQSQLDINTQGYPSLITSLTQSNSDVNNIPTTSTSTSMSTFSKIDSFNGLDSQTFNGSFQVPDYIENPIDAEDIKVPDKVKNFWALPQIEPHESPPITMPGLRTPNDLPDLIAIAVVKHLGQQELSHRKILGVGNVTQDEHGIRNLIAAGCYRAAVNLTAHLLTIHGQGFGRAFQPVKHTPYTLQLWFTRLALLVKLGEYDLLQKEAEPFGKLNRTDMYYEYYTDMYPCKEGSMVSFAFRLLLAELPIYFGDTSLALDNLAEMYVICNEIKQYFDNKQNQEAVEFWRRRELRILHSIVNCALILKNFNLIDDLLTNMISKQSDLSKEEKRVLFSAWGRIYLQIGDIFGAEQKFAEARRLRKFYSQADVRDLVDKGLITVAKNEYPEAYTMFQKALQLESGNTMVLNNMGVCLLYAGKLKDAINLFERAINLNPQRSLNESLLVNLCSLYELESNNLKNKKFNLLRLINRYKPDLNISVDICLKLQTV